MKFVVTQSLCSEGMEMLKTQGEVYVADDGNPNHYLDQMAHTEGLIVRIGTCDEDVISASPNLKVIGRTGVGYDSVDIEAATARGIPVVITPGANNRSVAEHSVALIFALAKNLVEGHEETRKGGFAKARGNGKVFELLGKQIGFIGLGAIGIETANLCRALGMETAAYDPYLSEEKIKAMGNRFYSSYEELLKESDIISVHVPLTEKTENMIRKEHFQMMKKTALIINCARGGIVNESDLAEALNDGLIAGAGIDVFSEEPPQTDHPLMKANNIIISPHSAAQTREAVIKMAEMCVEGCIKVIKGEKWPYVANPQAYQHEKWLGEK